MYKITYIHKDETTENVLYDPTNQDYALISARLSLAMGQSGELTVEIPEDNPCYDDIVCLTDEIIVYRDGEELWRGRSVTLQTDFYRTGTLDCEGILSYLFDTYYHPFEFPFDGENGDPLLLLQDVLDYHNSQVGDDTRKILKLGQVTVEDPNNYIARSSIYYSRTLEVLQEKFINDSLGGYFRVRIDSDGTRYLDYLENYNPNGEQAEQAIEFGENLLDVAQEVSYSDTASVILPLGAKIQDESGMDTDEYTTIESVNGGSVFYVDENAVKSYGWICVSVIWDDVTLPSNLLEHAKLYLAQVSGAVASFTVNAVDLSLAPQTDPNDNRAYANVFQLGVSILGNTEDTSGWEPEHAWNVGDMIRIKSDPHGLNQYAELSSMNLDLLNPQNDQYQFGGDTTTMTGSARNAQRDLETSLGSLSVRMDNLSLNVINAVYGNIEHIVSDTIDTNYIYAKLGEFDMVQTEGILAQWGIIENFEAVTADIDELYVNYEAVSGLLEATAIDVGNLSAITAQVVTLLGGDFTVGEITSIYLAADTTVIETAVIEEALVGTILADLLKVGYIDTNMIHIGSEDGTLMIDDSTILIYDSDGNPRIQIGLDGNGDYNLALWDADGNNMWNAGGVTEYGINDGVIRDDMVADDAAIQGSKLDIASVASCLNADGSLILQASQVYVGDEGLSIVLAEMQQQIDSIDPAEYEKYGICDVQDWFCVTDSDEAPDTPNDTRAYAEVFALGKSILGNTEIEGGWSTEQMSADEGQYLWTVTEYICYDGTIIWGAVRCMTDAYVRASTTTLLQEFEVMDGHVESLIAQVTTITGDVEGISNEFNLFYQTYDETISTISQSVDLATENASYAKETADNLVITVDSLTNYITDEMQILVPGYEYLESSVSWLIQSNEEISQGLVYVEELIDGLETEGLLDFQAYYCLSDDSENPPESEPYDDRAYAAIFALGTSVLGNTENSSKWSTEKPVVTSAGANPNLLNWTYGDDAVTAPDTTLTFTVDFNESGLEQIQPGEWVTLSFDAKGYANSNIVYVSIFSDGDSTSQWFYSTTDEWEHFTWTVQVPDNPGTQIQIIVAAIIVGSSSSRVTYNSSIRHVKLELGKSDTGWDSGQYIWMCWRKIHVDGTVTWTDPELYTDPYVLAQFSYINETLGSLSLTVGEVRETVDGVSYSVSELQMTVDSMTLSVTSDENGMAVIQLTTNTTLEGRNLLLGTTYKETSVTTIYSLTQYGKDHIKDKYVAFTVEVYGAGTMEAVGNIDGTEFTFCSYSNDGSTTDWTTLTGMILVSNDVPDNANVQITISGGMVFRHAKLEVSNESAETTSWSPAPEDGITMDIKEYFAQSDSVVTVGAGCVQFVSGTLTIDSAGLTLDAGGDAWFSGTLSAPRGCIGAWIIDDDAIWTAEGWLDYDFTGNLNSNLWMVRMQSPHVFSGRTDDMHVIEALQVKFEQVDTEGNIISYEPYGDPTFYVTYSGFLYAQNAEITGTIHATDGEFTGSIYAAEGKIGDWYIGADCLYNGCTSIDDTAAGTFLSAEQGIRQSNGYGDYTCIKGGSIEANSVDICGGGAGFTVWASSSVGDGIGICLTSTATYGGRVCGQIAWVNQPNPSEYLGGIEYQTSDAGDVWSDTTKWGMNFYCYDSDYVSIGDKSDWWYMMNAGANPYDITERHIFWGDVRMLEDLTVDGTLYGSTIRVTGNLMLAGTASQIVNSGYGTILNYINSVLSVGNRGSQTEISGSSIYLYGDTTVSGTLSGSINKSITFIGDIGSATVNFNNSSTSYTVYLSSLVSGSGSSSGGSSGTTNGSLSVSLTYGSYTLATGSSWNGSTTTSWTLNMASLFTYAIDMTNKLTISAVEPQLAITNSSSSGGTYVSATSWTGYGVWMGVGSGGYNRGVYDMYRSDWIIYKDSSQRIGINGTSIYLNAPVYVTDQDGVYVGGVQTVWSNGTDVGLGYRGGSQGVYIWGGSITLETDTTVYGDLLLPDTCAIAENSSGTGQVIFAAGGTRGDGTTSTSCGGLASITSWTNSGTWSASYFCYKYSADHYWFGIPSSGVTTVIQGASIEIGNNSNVTSKIAIGVSGDSTIWLQGATIYIKGYEYTVSDMAVKTNIAELPEYDADALDAITPVSFSYVGDNRIKLGYLAQDVQAAIPWYDIVVADDEGTLYMDYTQLIPLLHLKIKSQDDTIKALTSRIADLEEAMPKSK